MKHSVASSRHTCLCLMLVAVVGATGCATRRTIAPLTGPFNGAAAAQSNARAEAVRSDPRAYLHKVMSKCRALEQYAVTFTRQERRGIGIFKMLREPERIACKFRRNPFSVHMRWLDPEIKYGETTYVAGQHEDRVRFVPRHGLFGLPPKATSVNVQTPVVWGEAKYPITDFGLERMMERTFASIERAGEDVAISYRGLTRLSESDRVVHYLRLEFPSSQYRTPIQELFIDVETDLPACTRILYRSGRLEGAYVWEDVNPDVTLSDDDFLLESERTQRDPPGQATTASDRQ